MNEKRIILEIGRIIAYRLLSSFPFHYKKDGGKSKKHLIMFYLFLKNNVLNQNFYLSIRCTFNNFTFTMKILIQIQGGPAGSV